MHHGKTRIWNRGFIPDRCDELEAAAQDADPTARVWWGSHEDRPEDQGITILGTPVGRPEFVESALAKILANHRELLTRIPEVQDLQCAWLLLLYCGAARANFYIRTIRPELSAEFSQRHDEQMWHCFCKLLKTPPDAVAVSVSKAATLPLTSGGLGLRSAWRLREAAHWASWADTIKMVKARHPDIADIILAAVEARDEVPSVQAINQSVESLAEVGFVAPPWEELARGIVVPPNAEDADPNQPRVGWQAFASRLVESSFLEALRPTLSNAEGALLRSQGGPLASAPFVSFPMSRFARLEPQVLRVLFLRRLRLPLPLSARACRCGRPLDVLGHHRSACAVAGTLGRRGFPLENAAARICREAGGRVRTNVFVRDMDLGVVNQFDTRRLEVVV